MSSGGAVLDIQLSVSPTELNQVVLIGYGSVKRADLTGAISTVRSADITPAPVGSVDQALQGKAAGMLVTSVNGSPGAATSIRIRGGNSITASNEPLYVVDGYIGGGSLSSINTADIESVEVLKDASATAIYGARGANGVVLITTKRGKPGEPGITINGYTGTQKLPKEIGLLTGPQLAVYVNEITALNGTAPIYPDVSKVTNTDWQKAAERTAISTHQYLSVTQGSEKSKSGLFLGWNNENGIFQSDY